MDSWDLNLGRGRDLLLHHHIQTGPRVTQHLIQQISGALSPELQNLKCDVYNSPLLSFASTSHIQCSVLLRHRNSITFHSKGNARLRSYHCNENTKFWTHINHISISESELLFLLFVRIKNYSYLLRCYR